MINVEGLRVTFGGVTPLDGVDVVFPSGTSGLLGPNGAGKTTFFNVLSGFVSPSEGRVTAFGDDLLAMPDYRRARWGLRRTFQQEQAIEDLSVFDNVAVVLEHARFPRAKHRGAVTDALLFVGCDVALHRPVGLLGAGQRRLVEIARAVVGEPRLVLLDEPAAGLPDEETQLLAEVIQRIPSELGASVVLVDHDIDLVSACCEHSAVLDFGKLIASGPTPSVLQDERVRAAYLGDEYIEGRT